MQSRGDAGRVRQGGGWRGLRHFTGRSLFGLVASIRDDGGKLRVLLHSENLSDFLVQALGITFGPSARQKRVPDAVLRSPEPVVRAFLRA